MYQSPATDTVPPEPGGISLRLPRPFWFFLATAALILAAAGLRFGLPIYWKARAVHEIKRLGGSTQPRTGGPQWLRRQIGDRHMQIFDEVASVSLSHTPITDADLVWLQRHTHVETLYLDGTPITGAGLTLVAGLNDLKHIVLCDTGVDDAGLEHLQNLKKLETLLLDGTRITDDGLVHLKGIKSLDWLELNSTAITDAGLQHLKSLPNLRHINLSGTNVTDEGIADLKRSLPEVRVQN